MVYVTVNKHVSRTDKMITVFWGTFSTPSKFHWLINPQSLKVSKRVKEMCSRIPDIKHTTLLIGGGKK